MYYLEDDKRRDGVDTAQDTGDASPTSSRSGDPKSKIKEANLGNIQ